MMGWNYGGTGAGWLAMVMAMVAFWGLLTFAVVAIVRSTRKNDGRTGQAPQRDPARILDERLASGELDLADYHARLDALRGTSR